MHLLNRTKHGVALIGVLLVVSMIVSQMRAVTQMQAMVTMYPARGNCLVQSNGELPLCACGKNQICTIALEEENALVEVSCPTGYVIAVKSSFYGDEFCGSGAMCKGHCSIDGPHDCSGKQQCIFAYNNDVCGDPTPECVKDGKLTVECMSQQSFLSPNCACQKTDGNCFENECRGLDSSGDQDDDGMCNDVDPSDDRLLPPS